ncbi:MAG: hypothetical protein V3R93_06710 [Candidatus Hydrothermarchaeaceae archaeon]
MIAVPDCCTLIYYTKTNLMGLLSKIFDEIWVGARVYDECVRRGKEERKADAFIMERIIQEDPKFRVKDITEKEFQKEIDYFVGPGEAEVYLLSKKQKDTVVITSDYRAYKKMVTKGANNIARTDEILLEALHKGLLDYGDFLDTLVKFGEIGGTTESRIAFLTKKAMEMKRWEK